MIGPLGVSREGATFVFRVFSEHATGIELCLLDAGVERRVAMERGEGGVWEARPAGVGPGQRYGYRAHGPYAPREGHRFAPQKLLVDPYARLVTGRVDYTGPVFGYGESDDARDDRDSAAFVPCGVVVADEAPLPEGLFARPRRPWRDTVLYEAHVKGFTKLLSSVPAEERGTYLGLASAPAIAHLTALGVTAVELLPVHECVDEPKVARRGATNYWGYSTLGYFAPTTRYASRPEAAIDEFRTMVAALHRAGLEVILDVVYNHTCEGDATGPTLSLRGLDNRTYYELDSHDARKYADRSGCGNTLAIGRPAVLRLVMDSLRYWVTEMGVDGFRLDLASIHGRDGGAFDGGAAFFDAVYQDPVLRDVKLIAEPWDATGDGYALGGFPPPFREWNNRFRDDVRRFWNGYEKRVGPLADRLAGSSDVFGTRGPLASINFVTAHDGFTLRDLVSYEQRHNERNGEGNADGARENFSANFGVEGPSDEPHVREARARQVRAFLATLLLSPGVPMLVAGDEMARSQRGNNNAYCLDDATNWISWVLDAGGQELLAFTRSLLALRARTPALRRVRHFRGEGVVGGRPDVRWRRPDGRPLGARDWDSPSERALAMFIADDEEEGARPHTLALLVNGAAWPLDFVLPHHAHPVVLVDTATAEVHGPDAHAGLAAAGPVRHVGPRTLVLLRFEELP